MPSAPSREYIYADGTSGSKLLATVSSGGALNYYHQDHLSVRLITDSNGNNVGEQGHFPYGEAWYQNNTTSNWTFTTYERDSTSGLDYALARFYNSRMGSFCSADPVRGTPQDPQSWNRYVYARDNPADIADPSGKFFGLLLMLIQWLVNLGSGIGAHLGGLFGGFFGGSQAAAASTTSAFSMTSVSTVVGGTFSGTITIGMTITATPLSAFSTSGAIAAASGVAGATSTSAQQPQQAKPNCPPVPPHPKGADVDANIRAVNAEAAGAAVAHAPRATVWNWWIQMVKPHGPWDYKDVMPGGWKMWDDFGNFNYGATGSILTDEKTLLQGAALARYKVANPISNLRKYGPPWKGPNYGNDPHKNDMIRQGIQYRENHCGKF